ncbi:hypothetical protein PINS_up016316 [Pythium insidiosum]|nr:hypothetical protein PINS_up016316 [Pythium insidiosum]
MRSIDRALILQLAVATRPPSRSLALPPVVHRSEIERCPRRSRRQVDAEATYVQVLTPRASASDKSSPSKLKPTSSTDNASDTDADAKKAAARPPPAPFSQLYRYAEPIDKIALVVGVICAGANGALFPCMALVFGDAINAFQRADGGVDIDAINSAALSYLYIAIGLFVTDYISYVLFNNTAERQMKALRDVTLRHMLHLDIGWYDVHDALQLSSRLTGDTVKIKDGMGQKLGDSFKYTCQFFAGYIIGFSKGWDMSLVMSCVMPIMALSLASLLKMLRSRAEHSQKMYAEAGAVAEETLGSIRTVASLNGEHRAITKYNAKAAVAEAENIDLAKYSSSVFGLFMGSIWIMYAAGLWYGGSRVASNKTDPGSVFQGFFGVLPRYHLAGANLAKHLCCGGGPWRCCCHLSHSRHQVRNRCFLVRGYHPEKCLGRIEARNLHFTYPSRPDAKILNDYNVTIESGQTVAFVGASGGGKSTLIALLERFYDPQQGELLLDGRDVRTLNLRWLRSQIGLVSQEPVLFATTIRDNIAAGDENVTLEQVERAAKMANAHTFIMSLPSSMIHSLVRKVCRSREVRSSVSQLLALLFAILKFSFWTKLPQPLTTRASVWCRMPLNSLMDQTQMTTLVIAHRLSTVRRADKIVVLSGGRVVEEGPHDTLLAIPNGVYRNLYTLQEEKAKEEAEAAAAELAMAEAGADSANVGLRLRQMSTHSNKSLGEIDAGTGVVADVKAKFTILDAMAFSRPERKFFVVGMIAAGICGFALPASAVLISEMVTTMNLNYAKFQQSKDHKFLDTISDDVDDLRSLLSRWSDLDVHIHGDAELLLQVHG